MPLAILLTNLKKEDVPSDFEVSLTNKVADVLEKPVRDIITVIETDKWMTRGNETTPTCLLRLFSIARFDPESNPGYTEKFMDFLQQVLKIPRKRIVLQYRTDDPDYVGYEK